MDKKGKCHKFGIMRPVNEGDEIFVSKHASYKVDHSYRTIALLSKVIIKLGTLEKITPEIIERLYQEDLEYLINLYNQVNEISVLP